MRPSEVSLDPPARTPTVPLTLVVAALTAAGLDGIRPTDIGR